MTDNSKYKEFYDNAPTYSEALAALQDNACPEQVVADILSWKILLADFEDHAEDRISPYNYLFSAGIDNRMLSSHALDQIFNAHIEIIDEELEEFEGMGFNLETHEFIESFELWHDQVNLSSETIGKYLGLIEKVSKVESDARDSKIAEEIDFAMSFSWHAQIFEDIASHPNLTKEQKDKCCALSEKMRTKAAEAAED